MLAQMGKKAVGSSWSFHGALLPPNCLLGWHAFREQSVLALHLCSGCGMVQVFSSFLLLKSHSYTSKEN